MGKIKDLMSGVEIEMETLTGIMPVQYITISEEPFDVEEVNLQLQVAADEARGIE